ncbi:MAG: hypothetical protein DRP16_00555 [Candidatus Aenigmatarchaeota archaeon]|nr:MAG: hypothetical protein DRP16_00555 [Candidatus Aenigmarchaeota archaeon]
MPFYISGAQDNITPLKFWEHELSGYRGKRHPQDVHDPVYVTSFVIDDGKNAVGLASCDLLSLESESVKRIRKKVSKETRIPEENIMITCTHTHSAPAVFPLPGCGDVNKEYLEWTEERVSESLTRAWKNPRKKIEAYFSSGRLEGFGYNREKTNPWDEEPSTDFDDTLRVFYFGEGYVKDLILNFGCHPVLIERNGVMGRTEITRDFPGAVADFLHSKLFGYVLYTQGDAGDVDPVLNFYRKKKREVLVRETEDGGFVYESDWKTLPEYGRIMGERVLELLNKKEELSPEIRSLSGKIELPLIVKESENLPKDPLRDKGEFYEKWKEKAREEYVKRAGNDYYIDLWVQIFGIGEKKLVGIPAEVFSGIGRKIKDKHSDVITVNYANGNIGYIPDRESYGKGYYSHAFKLFGPFPLAENAEDVLVSGVDSLLREFEKQTNLKTKNKQFL